MILRMFNLLRIDIDKGVQRKYTQYCCVSGTHLKQKTEQIAAWINETGESLDSEEIEGLRQNKNEFIDVNEE